MLELAHKWGLQRLRDAAIRELDRDSDALSVLDRLALGRALGIPEWEYLAYAALAARTDPPSAQKAAQMGFETAFKISLVRETLVRDRTSPGPVDGRLQDAISNVFQIRTFSVSELPKLRELVNSGFQHASPYVINDKGIVIPLSKRPCSDFVVSC